MILKIFFMCENRNNRMKKSRQIRKNLPGFREAYLFLNKKRLSCHFLRLLHAHKLDQCRNDVCKASVLTKCVFRICVYQDKRNRVGCMSCPWLTCLIVYKLFCVTVVSTDKELSVNLFDCLYSLTNTRINSLNSLDRSCLQAFHKPPVHSSPAAYRRSEPSGILQGFCPLLCLAPQHHR